MKRFKTPKKIGLNLIKDTKLLKKVLEQKEDTRWQNFFKKKQTVNPLIRATKSYSVKQNLEKITKTSFAVRKNKKWRNTVKQLKKEKRETIKVFWKIKLEVILWESTLCRTIKEARQKITKGHVIINGQQIRSETYVIRPGDRVTTTRTIIKDKVKVVKKLPEYLEISFTTRTIIVAFIPIKEKE